MGMIFHYGKVFIIFALNFTKSQVLSSCLILYPKNTRERTGIQPFIYSLKWVGVQRINLLIPTSTFSPGDIALDRRDGDS